MNIIYRCTRLHLGFSRLAYGVLLLAFLLLPLASRAACTHKPTETADFSGTCMSDLLWQNPTTGELDIWFMNGSTLTNSVTVAASPTQPWVLQGVGDFNGDGDADMLWRNTTTGELDIWLMTGATIHSVGIGVNPNSDWTVQAVTDFNQDGKADILWRDNVSGELTVWFMNGATIDHTSVLPYSPSDDFSIVGVGDFNKDGFPDLLWQQSTTGSLSIWFMNGTNVTSSAALAASPDPGWSVQGVGDFNGDGFADILWRHACDGGLLNSTQCTESDGFQDTSFGGVSIWLMNAQNIVASIGIADPAADANVAFVNWYGECCTGAPNGWNIQSVGDFNGDGVSDIVWRQGTSGTVAIWQMSGTASTTTIANSAYVYSPPPSYVMPELAPYGCPTTVLCNMLNAINNIRANGSFGAGNTPPSGTALGPLLPLTWDVGAARAAKAWANQCDFAHPTAGNFNYGQNLAIQGPPGTGSDGVANWETEAASFTYAEPYPSCTDTSSNCGHYTQIVARNASALGCAVSQCPSVSGLGGGPYATEICNFSPGGNYSDLTGKTLTPY